MNTRSIDNSNPTKTYLGDGVYIQNDGYQLLMTTENGIEVTNKIALDCYVVTALQRFLAAQGITHGLKESGADKEEGHQ